MVGFLRTSIGTSLWAQCLTSRCRCRCWARARSPDTLSPAVPCEEDDSNGDIHGTGKCIGSPCSPGSPCLPQLFVATALFIRGAPAMWTARAQAVEPLTECELACASTVCSHLLLLFPVNSVARFASVCACACLRLLSFKCYSIFSSETTHPRRADTSGKYIYLVPLLAPPAPPACG